MEHVQVQVCKAWVGLRIQGVDGEDSREEETQERNGRLAWGNLGRGERTRGGINASKRMKLAER